MGPAWATWPMRVAPGAPYVALDTEMPITGGTTVTATPLDQQAAAWDAIAGGYDHHLTDLNAGLADQTLDELALEPDVRLLDVASGSGALALAAADRGADVVATDVAPTMVDALRARASRAGATVRAEVMDARDLDLDDAAFDVTASQLGVVVLPDLDAALAEMVRVTRPGGTVAVSGFGGPPPSVETLALPFAAVAQVAPHAPTLPTDPPPPPFQLADRDRAAERLEAAGLQEVRVATIEHLMAFASGDELWSTVVHSHPIAAATRATLSEEQDAAIRAELDHALAARGERPALLRVPLNVGIGTRPPG